LDWWVTLIIIFGGFVVLLFLGIPVAFAFMTVNIIGIIVLWGGTVNLGQLVLSIWDSLTAFSLLPVPLFVLMGEIMFHTGIASQMISALDKWLGRLPGRLALLTVGAGTIFATLSGSSIASCAMLGSVLVPEMQKRGYKYPMSIGPILGCGGLAIMIPPSALGILLAAIANISAGTLLIATIIPGLMMAFIRALYLIIRAYIQPELAPVYESPKIPWSEKFSSFAAYVMPLALVVFAVIGVLYLGVATATEAAALGALACFILALAYRKLNWALLHKSVYGTVRVAVMMLIIFMGSSAFAQILAYTGASSGLLQVVTGLNLSPILIVVGMQLTLLIMGMFMEPLSIMMVSLPIYMPIILALNLNPIWFGAIVLLNMEIATTSPPFGLNLYVMKGVVPSASMADIYKAAMPFIICDLVIMILMLLVPATVMWLPQMMG
jgi:tripartite ATP-independent transporter DctM subunit